MKYCKKLVSWFLPSFASKHYRCALCGVNSATPDELCAPIEIEFER